jgi:hypothetical protein
MSIALARGRPETRPGARDALLVRAIVLRVLIEPLLLTLVGFVMADDTAGERAELAVTGHVSGDAADDRTLDAALGLRSNWRAQRTDQSGQKYQFAHDIPRGLYA